MEEASAAVVSRAVAPTIAGSFWKHAQLRKDKVLLRQKELGVWNELTWAGAAERVQLIASGLVAMGARRGSTAAIVSRPRRDWLLADLAAQGAGVAVAGLDPERSADELAHQITECAAEILILEDGFQVAKYRQCAIRLTAVRIVIVLDATGLTEQELSQCITLEQVVDAGRNKRIEVSELDRLAADEVAALVYTQGASGRPRAVGLSSARIIAACGGLDRMIDAPAESSRAVFQSMSHYLERICGVYHGLLAGHTLHFVEARDTALADLKEIQPHVLIAAERIWAELRTTTSLVMLEATAMEQRMYRWALSVSAPVDAANAGGIKPSPLASLRRYVARRLVLGNLLRMMGLDRTQCALVGGTSCGVGLLDWFCAMGIPLRESWGMTEVGGIAMVSGPRHGTFTTTMSDVCARCSPEGELILVDETSQRLLRTGDLARQLHAGGLKIVGRQADVFRLESGVEVDPGELERALRESEFIDRAVVVGAGRPAVTALVSVNSETIRHWAKEQAIRFSDFASLAGSEPVRELIAREVARINTSLALHLRVRDFRIFERAFHPGDDEVTAIGTLRRSSVLEKYQPLITQMYGASRHERMHLV